MSTSTPVLNLFAIEVHAGLSQQPKTLPCKYFYDAKGDEIFQAIMQLEEYYLTRAEREIFETQKAEILRLFSGDRQPFSLVELGAGDGSKTKILLDYFLSQGIDCIYSPVDISANILEHLAEVMHQDLPELPISPIQGDYFHTDFLQIEPGRRHIVLFLGSNIGNLSDYETDKFLSNIAHNLQVGDLFLIGFDLMKDPSTILNAYNDAKGVTRDFNLNLLTRMNRELDGNFVLDRFQHAPVYDPLTGEARSYLVSTMQQTVTLSAIGETYTFEAWEAIHMETSRKYSQAKIAQLAETHGFRVVKNFSDSQNFYVNSVWEKC